MNYLFLIIVIAIVLAVIAIASFSNLELDDVHYDRLKALARKWDYIVVFVAAVAKVFNMPYGMETVTVVAAIGALMCGLLDVSTKNFNKPIPVDIEGLKYIEDDEGADEDE